MKPRRVMVTLELETMSALCDLRSWQFWACDGSRELCVGDVASKVIQVQANVIKPSKKKAKKR